MEKVLSDDMTSVATLWFMKCFKSDKNSFVIHSSLNCVKRVHALPVQRVKQSCKQMMYNDVNNKLFRGKKLYNPVVR